MSAGLPGVGLSGVFFIVSALLMVPLEVARTLRGRSSLARWIGVLRQLAIAVTMIACVELAYALIRWVVGRTPGVAGIHTVPLLPIFATLGVIAVLLAVAKAAQLVVRRRAMIPACFVISSRRWLRVPPRASASAVRSRQA